MAFEKRKELISHRQLNIHTIQRMSTKRLLQITGRVIIVFIIQFHSQAFYTRTYPPRDTGSNKEDLPSIGKLKIQTIKQNVLKPRSRSLRIRIQLVNFAARNLPKAQYHSHHKSSAMTARHCEQVDLR